MSLLPDFISTTLWPLASSPGWGGLIALLALAAVIDLRSGRIPNWLTVTGMGWGLAFSASQGLGTGAGLATGLAGLATGLAVMLPRPRYFEKLPQSPYLAERAEVIAGRMNSVELP